MRKSIKNIIAVLFIFQILFTSNKVFSAEKTGFSLFRCSTDKEKISTELSIKLLQINADIVYLERIQQKDDTDEIKRALQKTYAHFYFFSETGTLIASKYALREPRSTALPKDRGAFIDFILVDKGKEVGHLYFMEGAIKSSDIEEAAKEMHADYKENEKVPYTLSLPLEKELLVLKSASINQYEVRGVELPLFKENKGILTAIRRSIDNETKGFIFCAKKDSNNDKNDSENSSRTTIEAQGNRDSRNNWEGSAGITQERERGDGRRVELSISVDVHGGPDRESGWGARAGIKIDL